jgi:hypothetical protein
MTDIELVIKIPENIYKNIQSKSTEIQAEGYTIENAILNGIPLPQNHGRLIDADKLPLDAIDDANYGSNYIKIAPTIIEADKGE